MKIPKKIEVLGVDYETVWKWNLHHDDGSKCDGICEDGLKQILLERAMTSDDEKELTYIHECVHAVLAELRYAGHIPERAMSLKTEEAVAEGISRFFHSRFHLRLKK